MEDTGNLLDLSYEAGRPPRMAGRALLVGHQVVIASSGIARHLRFLDNAEFLK